MSIQVVAALCMEDHAAAEAAELLSPIVAGVLESDPARGHLLRAWWLFRIAAHVEDLETFAELADMAKEQCRQAALVWLQNRECACCIALREKLERETYV